MLRHDTSAITHIAFFVSAYCVSTKEEDEVLHLDDLRAAVLTDLVSTTNLDSRYLFKADLF